MYTVHVLANEIGLDSNIFMEIDFCSLFKNKKLEKSCGWKVSAKSNTRYILIPFDF